MLLMRHGCSSGSRPSKHDVGIPDDARGLQTFDKHVTCFNLHGCESISDRKACRRDELLNLVEEDPELLAVARAQVHFARVSFAPVGETKTPPRKHHSANPMSLQGLRSGNLNLGMSGCGRENRKPSNLTSGNGPVNSIFGRNRE